MDHNLQVGAPDAEPMNLTVLILTRNEARHIVRAIELVRTLAARIVVVDSGSTDGTVALARAAGAVVLDHPWVNYARQMNWALDQLDPDTDWVMRLDADEVVTPSLVHEIARKLPVLEPEVHGVIVSRRMTFLGRPIRWGGIFPVRVLRLFRHGHGRIEDRWMDEHVLVSGATANFCGEIVDDNLNSLTWWTEKHNTYSSREVVDLLNLEHNFMIYETVANLAEGQQAGVKRWIKERIYARLPGGLRAFVYFAYRYLVRLGFLDGAEGTAFHVLQGFWYRYLVDVKLHEVQKHMAATGDDPVVAIRKISGIRVEQ